MTIGNPMLAYKDAKAIKFPCLVSPKIDGIRAMVHNGVVLSRALKPIPNVHVQELFGRPDFEGFDGELVVGSPTASNCMQVTSSAVMREEGEPAVTFYVFDAWNMDGAPYSQRYGSLATVAWDSIDHVELVPHRMVHTPEQLAEFEEHCLAFGYEGAMANNPESPYKNGRAGKTNWELVKIKRFEDGECTIVGFEEMMHNDNEKTTNELGHSKRSSHKENKRAAGTLGKLVCKVLNAPPFAAGTEFRIGTGFTAAMKADIWARQAELLGAIVTFKHFAVTGVKDAPRIPVFKAFRDTRDL